MEGFGHIIQIKFKTFVVTLCRVNKVVKPQVCVLVPNVHDNPSNANIVHPFCKNPSFMLFQVKVQQQYRPVPYSSAGLCMGRCLGQCTWMVHWWCGDDVVVGGGGCRCVGVQTIFVELGGGVDDALI